MGDNGAPNFLNKPECHGNPGDPKGSPVTMHWGFDIIDFINQKSALDTTVKYIDDFKRWSQSGVYRSAGKRKKIIIPALIKL